MLVVLDTRSDTSLRCMGLASVWELERRGRLWTAWMLLRVRGRLQLLEFKLMAVESCNVLVNAMKISWSLDLVGTGLFGWWIYVIDYLLKQIQFSLAVTRSITSRSPHLDNIPIG